MPVLNQGDTEIYYEVHGQGYPVLTFAPMGLLSTVAVWDLPNAPIKPLYELSDEFQIIVMDQRNAGGNSHAPLTAQTNWDDYAQDHLAVLDYLGIKTCHLFGQCIGGPFIFKLLDMCPERFSSAVIAQSIGRADGLDLPARTEIYNRWASALKAKTNISESVFDQFYQNLYGSDFVYSVDKSALAKCEVPTAVFAGNDGAHPISVSRDIAALLPNNEVFLKEWKTGQALEVAKVCTREFLTRHTPA